MKIRSLSLVIALTAVASAAAAGEAIHAASHRAPADRVHAALGPGQLGLQPVTDAVAGTRSSTMPACSTCH